MVVRCVNHLWGVNQEEILRTLLKPGIRPIRRGRLDTFTVSQAAQIGIGQADNTFVVGEGRHIDPSKTLSSDFTGLPINVRGVVLYRHFRVVEYTGSVGSQDATESLVGETFSACVPRDLVTRQFVTPFSPMKPLHWISLQGQRLREGKDFDLARIMAFATHSAEPTLYLGGRDLKTKMPMVVCLALSSGRVLGRYPVGDHPGSVIQLAVHGSMVATVVNYDDDQDDRLFLSLDPAKRLPSFRSISFSSDFEGDKIFGLSFGTQGIIGQCGDKIRLRAIGGGLTDIAAVSPGFGFTGLTPAPAGDHYLTFVSHERGLRWQYQPLPPVTHRATPPNNPALL